MRAHRLLFLLLTLWIGCKDSTNGPTPNLLPDIAFTAFGPGAKEEVFVARLDGSLYQQITFTPSPASSSTPSLSPDRRTVVYVSNGEILSVPSLGGTVRNLTNNTAVDVLPAWSPNGEKLLFRSDRSGQIDPWLMNADGTNPIKLTPDSAVWAGVWSKDGSKVALLRGFDSVHIVVVNADGSHLTKVTPDSLFVGSEPNWSPSGGTLVFGASAQSGTGPYRLFTINLDGSQLTPLTSSADDYSQPLWSPAGNRILSSLRATSQLVLMNTDGSGSQTVASSLTAGMVPRWSPDGSSFAVVDGATFKIFIVSLDGTFRRLTTSTLSERFPSW